MRISRDGYRQQTRLMPAYGRRGWPKFVLTVLIIAWGVALYGVEILRAMTGIDYPFTLNWDVFFWLMLRGFPQVMSVGLIVLHLNLSGTAANFAGSAFLQKGSPAYHLLAMTPSGLRRFLFHRMAATSIRLIPYAAVMTVVTCALAVYHGYERMRTVYFYRSMATGEMVIEISTLDYSPQVGSFFAAAGVSFLVHVGTTIFVAGVGITAAAFFPRYRIGASVVIRMLIISLMFAANALIWRIFPLTSALHYAVIRGIGAFVDGGTSFVTSYMDMFWNQFGGSHDQAIWAFAYVVLCIAVAGLLYGLCLWRLRPR